MWALIPLRFREGPVKYKFCISVQWNQIILLKRFVPQSWPCMNPPKWDMSCGCNTANLKQATSYCHILFQISTQWNIQVNRKSTT